MLEWKDKIPDGKIFLKLVNKLHSHKYIEQFLEKEFLRTHRFINSFFSNKYIASDEILREVELELEKWIYNNFEKQSTSFQNSIYHAGLAQIALIYVIFTYQLFPGEELIARSLKYYKKKKFYKHKLSGRFENMEKKNKIENEAIRTSIKNTK